MTFNYFEVYTTTAYYITYAQYPIIINPVNKFVLTHCVKIFCKIYHIKLLGIYIFSILILQLVSINKNHFNVEFLKCITEKKYQI